jgi:hypothetical protein
MVVIVFTQAGRCVVALLREAKKCSSQGVDIDLRAPVGRYVNQTVCLELASAARWRSAAAIW